MPGLLLGAYPEREHAPHAAVHVMARARGAAGGVADRLRRSPHRAFAAQVIARADEFARTPATLPAHRDAVRVALAREGLTVPLQREALALIYITAQQVLGRQLFPSQIVAARIMLANAVAEMATGEGKTLAAGAAAAVAALAGIPVHVITVNDYLVARDAESLRPLYAALGLTVGAILAAHDVPTRQRAYGCDITYCTAKELVFDYLRDRTQRPRRSPLELRAAQCASGAVPGPTLLRGLCMAIVDEADSVLIDEARVPLVLSQAQTNASQHAFYGAAMACAQRLVQGAHFVCATAGHQAHLTPAGCAQLARLRLDSAAWHNPLHREETVRLALAALHTYQRDRHYLVRDGQVAIIDEATGRVAPGRVWSRGLHQLVELKEGCAMSPDQVTATQITYQRFFRRYLRLCGMSGTVHECRRELAAVYALPVVRVPRHRPLRRTVLPTRLFSTRHARWQAVVQRVRELTPAGRAVLIGTDSVAESHELSRFLTAAGIAHEVLNAAHDRAEAEIVAGAGRAGQVTVATNMAGRGTDIPLAAEVAAGGGLHVIACQHNASRRIDRQLHGRAARQGDPGSIETLLTRDHSRLARLLLRVGAHGRALPRGVSALLTGLPQWLAERAARRARRELLRHDTNVERHFAAAGLRE